MIVLNELKRTLNARRTIVAIALTLAAWSLVVTASASASFGVQSFGTSLLNEDGTPAVQAGSHPASLTASFGLNTHYSATYEAGGSIPYGSLKDASVSLPPGLIVDPEATEIKCAEAEIESEHQCPPASAVGSASVTSNLFGQPYTSTSPVYNMVAPPGSPAQFAFNALSVGVIVHLDTHVRTGSDYGLSASVTDISQKTLVIGTSVTLWGDPSAASHDSERELCGGCSRAVERVDRPLLTVGSSCGASAAASLTVDSWQEPENVLSASFTSPFGVVGCDQLDFSPRMTVIPDTQVANTPSGLNVDLRIPQLDTNESLAEAGLKKAEVRLPVGVRVSPTVASGLEACSEAQIGLHDADPVACPDASKIGSVEVDSPLLGVPLMGGVYVAAQGSNPFGSLLALYLAVEADGVLVKLPGEVSVDAVTGQVVATFDDVPQLPFSELKLSLFGGPHAPLVTPTVCGTYTTTALLTPYSSETPVESNSAFAVTSGCGDGFGPSFVAGTANNEAGAFSPFSVSFSRGDGDQELGGVSVTTPPGLLGILKGVERCPEPQASQGTCGAGSLVGHTTVGAGAGPDPFYVPTGQVFLTGPYKGAPFGLSIVVPAVAGPFDLGTVVVRAAVRIDPRTAQITVVSDPLPTILQGIPLQIKSVSVAIDRGGFIFNPTSCEPLSVGGTLTSTQGASAAVSSRFQAANCAALPFKPAFTVTTKAGTSKKQGASLLVKGTFPAGEANIHSVGVVLPKQLPARLTTIQQACPEAVFDANPAGCPAGSNIGTGTAVTPILAGALSGPAYLVSHGGASFPDLVVILQGEGVTVDLTGSIDIKHGVTSSTFAAIPDAPITTFQLSLPEGPHSGLAAVVPAKAKGSLCGQSLPMPFTITGQNGAVVKQPVKIAVTGCPRAKKKAVKHTQRAHGKQKHAPKKKG